MKNRKDQCRVCDHSFSTACAVMAAPYPSASCRLFKPLPEVSEGQEPEGEDGTDEDGEL